MRRRSRRAPGLRGVMVESSCGPPADVGLGDGVEAPLVERVAASDAPYREPPAPARAEAPDRVVSVVRARGLVPAAAHHPEERTDGHLVDPDDHQADALHALARAWTDRPAAPRADARAARSSGKGISVALPGRLTTRSSLGYCSRSGAIAARSRRRARFRRTAPPAPGIENATLDTSSPPPAARTRSTPERASLPVSRTAAIRRRPERRCRRFIASGPA